MKLLTSETHKVEQKTATAERMKENLEVKQVEVEKREQVVNNDLAKAEPALIAATNSVNGVSAKDIKELQGYRNPPPKIKFGLQSCIALVKNMHTLPDWNKDVLPALRQEGFKSSVLEFAKENISGRCKTFVINEFLNKPEYDIQGFYKASKALGPLAEWTKSIIEFADIYERIAPMREELNQLSAEKQAMEEEMKVVEAEIKELNDNKDRMTKEYTMLVQE